METNIRVVSTLSTRGVFVGYSQQISENLFIFTEMPDPNKH